MDDEEKRACFHCECRREGEDQKDCRYYIDYEEDSNCCLVAVGKNGKMSVKEISKRIGVGPQRIYQIEKKALRKIKENNK